MSVPAGLVIRMRAFVSRPFNFFQILGEFFIVKIENRGLINEIECLIDRVRRVEVIGVMEPVKVDSPPFPCLQDPFRLTHRMGAAWSAEIVLTDPQIRKASKIVPRGNQGDSGASIRMRERLVIAAGWLCKWFFRQEESLVCQADMSPITR